MEPAPSSKSLWSMGAGPGFLARGSNDVFVGLPEFPQWPEARKPPGQNPSRRSQWRDRSGFAPDSLCHGTLRMSRKSIILLRRGNPAPSHRRPPTGEVPPCAVAGYSRLVASPAEKRRSPIGPARALRSSPAAPGGRRVAVCSASLASGVRVDAARESTGQARRTVSLRGSSHGRAFSAFGIPRLPTFERFQENSEVP